MGRKGNLHKLGRVIFFQGKIFLGIQLEGILLKFFGGKLVGCRQLTLECF
jgi:hypothetical protein